ncbi:Type I secretion target GGXGXDXXX repeat protein domain protein [Candidatus Jidaibacter acanthamoeba]|uniref:Type I secretion target GGXGXDXXX repeat protein domain protein n=1 Tax=Candidatus Jidaibacter acanthamoebae TaxID=86105 RepID=A0A0C1QXD3_9RICK|nr:FG-GAP repeat protein [Candidatus Jidaibacter acanthamoeba]KIE04670.1 Type I secretion target GGXGXDXXX repeat protein domain protein [Candidatus Jidaibacter acanthamoeba]
MTSLNNPFYLSSLNGKNGFKLIGDDNGELGWQISSAGDVNGDGINDIIVGAQAANKYAGKAYVIFGKDSKFSSKLSVSNLNGSNGFQIIGENSSDALGFSVSGAGDINGDGLHDIIIGAPGKNNQLGEGYVVFGSKSGFPSTINVSDLDGSNGFAIIGDDKEKGSSLGMSVSGAGDMNGDGLDDIVISAPQGIINNGGGVSYVLYGSNLPLPPIVNLTNLVQWKGLTIYGEQNSISGQSIGKLGDINGDGLDDIIIGARNADNGIGAAYVVYGKGSGNAPQHIYPYIEGNNGFKIQGDSKNSYLGSSVSGIGDVNGDGLNDLVVSSDSSGPCGGNPTNYILYGSKDFSNPFSVSGINGNNGFAIKDSTGASLKVKGAGDINNDGLNDLIISKSYNACGGQETSYVLFGDKLGFPPEIYINQYNLNGSHGFQINKVRSEDSMGYSVSGVGDVNNDGIADFAIGAPFAHGDSGVSYIVFGTENIEDSLGGDSMISNFFSQLVDMLPAVF